MALQLGDLPANVQEIFYANKTTDYVANFCGTRLYDSSRGWGRLWRWIYSFIGLFDGGSLKQAKLQQAIEKIHRVFHEQLKILEQSFKAYSSYVNDNGEDKLKDENFNLARYNISEWNDQIRPFVRNWNSDSRIKELFTKHLGAAQGAFKLSEAFQNSFRYQPLIDLEFHLGSLSVPLPPVKALSELVRTLESSKSDAWNKVKGRYKDVFEEFAVQIFKSSKEVPLKMYQKGLITLIDQGRVSKADIVTRITYLMEVFMEFEPRLKNLYGQRDEQHITWRNKLKTGSKIKCNEIVYTLGRRVGSIKGNDKDNNLYYEVEEDNSILVWIAQNRIIPGLKYQIRARFYVDAQKDDENDHILTVIGNCEIKSVDFLGRCAFVEKLHTPLNELQWPERISKEQSQLLDILSLEIQLYSKSNRIPRHFSAKHIMHDQKGKLKFSKITDFIEMDTMLLFLFARDVANGNFVIYQHLILKSKIMKLPNTIKLSEIFQEIFLKTIKGNPPSKIEDFVIENSLQKKNILSDENFCKYIKKFIMETKTFRDKCFELINKRLNDSRNKIQIDDIHDKIMKEMSAWYKASNTVGFIWPGLENKFVESCTCSRYRDLKS